MQYFLDSASLPLIEKALSEFPLAGVTTNPIILARDIPDNANLSGHLHAIRNLTEGKKLFVQVTGDTADGMVNDAQAIVKALGGDLCIKVPCVKAGFEAIRTLSGMGIHTLGTACYSTAQAMLAAAAGADYVAPYVSHIDNLSQDGAVFSGLVTRMLMQHGFKTQVLAASFRTVEQVQHCLEYGVQAVTVTAEMLDRLTVHPGTILEVEAFRKSWSARFDKGIADLL